MKLLLTALFTMGLFIGGPLVASEIPPAGFLYDTHKTEGAKSVDGVEGVDACYPNCHYGEKKGKSESRTYSPPARAEQN